MLIQLTPIEARILGSLVEKSLTTPDLYPLTFNSLVNACNQKTSREPVMSLDVDSAGKGIQALIDQALVGRFADAGGRVPKFKHFIDKLLGVDEPKLVGAICVLLLRGPQTPGEIKTRSERLCRFESTAEVEALMQDLCARPEPLVARLPRQAGQKESRYQQLFSGAAPVSAPEATAAEIPGSAERLAQLEKRVEALEESLQALSERLEKPVL